MRGSHSGSTLKAGLVQGVPASRGYEGGFGVDLMLKDLGLATDVNVHGIWSGAQMVMLQAGKMVKQSLPLGSLAQQLYAHSSGKGNGHLDFGSIFEFLQKEK